MNNYFIFTFNYHFILKETKWKMKNEDGTSLIICTNKLPKYNDIRKRNDNKFGREKMKISGEKMERGEEATDENEAETEKL